jgi:hypothetical protein
MNLAITRQTLPQATPAAGNPSDSPPSILALDLDSTTGSIDPQSAGNGSLMWRAPVFPRPAIASKPAADCVHHHLPVKIILP